jgi:bile acid-coenzyme A ligase
LSRISYGRVVTELAARDPEAVAVVHEGTELRRGELERRSNRLARAYAERGVEPGDLVSIGLPNGIGFICACLATWKLGAVPNPVSPRLPAAERSGILDRARPALVVGASGAADEGRPTLPADFEPDPKLSDAPLPDRLPPHERAMASGGSTGQPKLIVAANPASYDPEAPSPFFKARRAALVPGPLYHAAPFSSAWQAIFGGATAVVMTRFDAAACLELIERHRVDRVCLVPTMMLRIWRLPARERERRDLSCLEFVMSGGAPLPPWLMRAWIDWLGPDVMNEAFGPSERIGGTFITGREWLEHPGSVGKPSLGSRIRILDPESGRDLPPGEMGEIYMLPAGGPGSTYRYLGAEPRAISGGWESVGDMGYVDEDGYLYLGDRRTDMIVTGGRNVYPAEVEAALEEHPGVRSSCVVGLPDDDLGSRVHALVEASEPIPAEALRAHLEERLVPYKIPRSVEFVNQPLRDEAGKVRRSTLREECIARLDSGSRG